MTEQRVPQSFYSPRRTCALYYTLIAAWGAGQLFVPENSAIDFLARLTIALPATLWLIRDAQTRNIDIPHIVQPAVLALWVFVVPVYLVRTRKLKGLGWVVVHLIGTLLVTILTYNIAILCYWGPSAYTP